LRRWRSYQASNAEDCGDWGAAVLCFWRVVGPARVMTSDVAEPRAVNKPAPKSAHKPKPARPLADLIGPCLVAAFKRHGFASTEIVTHWDDIVGPEIAAQAEPIRITWPRQRDVADEDDLEPATLVLRCQGPAALEIQHQSSRIIERVNRFLGWRAVGAVRLRQAPLTRRPKPRRPAGPDPAEVRRIANTMTGIADEKLRTALGRLGAAVKRK
jgi:hypothetical protein